MNDNNSKNLFDQTMISVWNQSIQHKMSIAFDSFIAMESNSYFYDLNLDS